MTTTHSTHRRGLVAAAIAAVGLTSFGIVSQASADPVPATTARRTTTVYGHAPDSGSWVLVNGRYEWRVRPTRGPIFRDDDGRYNEHDHRYVVDRNHNGVVEPYERDFMTFDSNRDGTLGATERKGYWMRQAESERYGEMSKVEMERFAHLAYIFDRNADGRLLGRERVGMDTLTLSIRRFDAIDRDGDHFLNRYEIARNRTMLLRFNELDLNNDNRVSRQEIRDSVLKAYRDGVSVAAVDHC